MLKFLLLSLFLVLSHNSFSKETKFLLVGDIATIRKSLSTQLPKLEQKQVNFLVDEISSLLTSTNGARSPVTLKHKDFDLEIITLDHLISSKISKKSEKKLFDNLKVIEQKRNFLVDSYKLISIDCSNCYEPGNKNLKLYLSLDNKEKEVWISGTLKHKITGYKIKKNIPAFTAIQKNGHISKHSFFSDKPEQYIQSLDDPSIYQANKPLLSGSLLKRSDLSHSNLISTGSMIKVYVKTKNIVIKGNGKAMQNGKFNQIIRVKKSNSNKIITGKVTGHNSVEVDI